MISRLAGLCAGLGTRVNLASSCWPVWPSIRCMSAVAEETCTAGPLTNLRVVDLTRLVYNRITPFTIQNLSFFLKEEDLYIFNLL